MRVGRRHLLLLAALLCGALIGGSTAFVVAERAQLRQGEAALGLYAERLLAIGVEFAQETDRAVTAVADDRLAPCSDAEIGFMRDFVYNSASVKNIGRIQDGRLQCSTNLGRLDDPAPLPSPGISVGGTDIYIDLPSMISGNSKGFVTVAGGIAVALNPGLYQGIDQPPMTYSGLFRGFADARVLRGFGHDMPLTAAEIIAGQLLERGGIFYLPSCSDQAMFCVIAAEPQHDMMAARGVLRPFFLASGAGFGASLALVLALLYLRERSLERQLRRAVRRGTLTLAYQPVVDLSDGRIVGAEALVRWRKSDGEAVRPDVFIALAEERRFVGDITRFVVRRAVAELADLLAGSGFRLTLNITAQDLADPNFPGFLADCLGAAGVDPSRIGLELTERSTADQQGAIEAIARLKLAGHTVYIDDFGTGYSSLSYLHRLAADVIKIDRAFTQTIGTEAVTASVVPQILEIARRLGLRVVVEGIETADQAAYFRAAGSDVFGQGWLFGKPVAALALRRLVAGA